MIIESEIFKIDLMTTNRLAETYALSQYLSEYDELNYDEIMEALSTGEVPDSVIIWQPFEDYDAEELLALIERTRDDFLAFAKQITE